MAEIVRLCDFCLTLYLKEGVRISTGGWVW